MDNLKSDQVRFARTWKFCGICFAKTKSKTKPNIICQTCNYGCCATCKPRNESTCSLCKLAEKASSNTNEKQLRNKTFLIIGGSIVGLSTALALIDKGFQVHVVERREISGKLTRWKNIINLYGGPQEMLRKANPSVFSDERMSKVGEVGDKAYMYPFTHSKKPIVFQFSEKERVRHGVPFPFALVRDEFMSMLIEAIETHPNSHLATLQGSKNLIKVNKNAATGGVIACFEDNTEIEADYLIGADGINSFVRNNFFQQEQRKAKIKIKSCGHHTIQGLSKEKIPEDLPPQVEIWGNKGRALLFKTKTLNAWMITQKGTLKQNDYMDTEEEEEAAKKKFIAQCDAYPEYFKTMIKSSEPTTVSAVQVSQLSKVMPVLYKDRYVIVGDAAHAMSNGLGSGACMGIEDGFSLADLLSLHIDAADSEDHEIISKALTEWSERRPRRVAFVRILAYAFSAALSNYQGFFVSRLRAFIFGVSTVNENTKEEKRSALFDPVVVCRATSDLKLKPQTLWL